MEKAFDAVAQWPMLCCQYDLDPEIGILVKPEHKVTSFDFEKLNQCMQKMGKLQTKEEFGEFFSNFPEIKIEQERRSIDMVILHSLMASVLLRFIDYCKMTGKEVTGVILPKNIALPLYVAATQIKVTYGMIYGQQMNWIPIHLPVNYQSQSFSLKDFELRTYLTNNPKMEKLFFGASIIGSFYIGKMIKLIYQMNCFIEHAPMEQKEVLKRLQLCKKYWKKIIEEDQTVISELDINFFGNNLLKIMSAFQGIVFEGVDQGKDKTLNAPLPSGGTDPSFQIFDKGFGFKYSDGITEGHQRLRTMMPEKSINLMKYFEEKSMIREYCDCTLELSKAYNEVVGLYKEFFFLHQSFLKKFVFGSMQKAQQAKQQKSQGPPLDKQMKGFLSHFLQIEGQALSLKEKH